MQKDIKAVEALQKAPTKFALALMDVLFTKEKMVKSLVTKKEGRDLLEPSIIEGIRCEFKCCEQQCALMFLFLLLSVHIKYKGGEHKVA